MKNKNKKILFISLIGVSSMAVIMAIANSGTVKSVFKPDASTCDHSHVEHYAAPITNGSGYVEHWACCECHTAWADEGRTNVIGNTVSDRDKLTVSSECTYQTEYNPNMTIPVYDEEHGFLTKNYLSNLDKSGTNEIATINSAFKLEDKGYSYFVGRVKNTTSQTLSCTLFDRTWKKSLGDFSLAPSESHDFLVNATDWGNTQQNGNYGFAIYIRNTEALENGSYVELSKPIFVGNYLKEIQSGDWTTFSVSPDFDNENILYTRGDVVNANLHFMNRTLIDESLYTGVAMQVYNDSDVTTTEGTAWNEDWAPGHSAKVSSLVSKAWNDIFIPANVWNGDDSMVSIYDWNEINGGMKIRNLTFNKKGQSYVCFGENDNEKLTYDDGVGWPESIKTEDPEMGKVFLTPYQPVGNKCIVTNNAKTVDSKSYSAVEFYAYNGCDKDFTMNSTSDWNVYTQYGTIVKGQWTKCSMSVEEWNKAGNKYFYIVGDPAGDILFTYFKAVA